MQLRASIRQCLALQGLLALIYVLFLCLSGVWYSNTHLTVVPSGNIFPPTQTNTRSSSRYDILPLHPDFPLEPRPRPPLESILQGKWNITGDASWLLNVAIVGFPKTGTSTLMKYLHQSPQVHIFDEERCEIEWNQQAVLIRDLYQRIPEGHLLRGLKCPRDLEVPQALRNYQTYFPQTDFLVGLRHPIEWFESFYNFRVQNLFPMPPAQTLIGRCSKRHQGVCTFRGNFHLFLANMGKTRMGPQERALIPKQYQSALQPVPLKGRIFLWDISQLKQDHTEEFRHDLQHFLRLDHPLPATMLQVKPGFRHRNQTTADQVAALQMDICQSQYEALRQVLLEQGALAARWIRDYFLEAEGVYVSQKDHWKNVILKQWEQDPCDAGRRRGGGRH